jgi:ATP-dependent DNA ligase
MTARRRSRSNSALSNLIDNGLVMRYIVALLRNSSAPYAIAYRVVMDLPVMSPLSPMLAKAIPSLEKLPAGAYHYEPKFDGFRRC